ncbi:Dirigent protein 10 [Glycine soja]|uniref:Dirigent protein n=1 Tax=Glycine soja TaxID=3848 RepID=A0A445LXN9_GLYSO|nr:Dirigent protein 10 [Glycine soja]
MTVFDDELTEGHELGSGLVGKAQGFYIASAVDGTKAMYESGKMFMLKVMVVGEEKSRDDKMDGSKLAINLIEWKENSTINPFWPVSPNLY